MRLLDSSTLRLTHFVDRELPEYVILSHCWGDDEVTFSDIQDLDTATARHGFQKIRQFCQKAKSDGFQWVWIDTCCIDKSSSAELSEAINSMYQYYGTSEICYVYLEDVSSKEVRWPGDWVALKACKWFTRGWTLQELIAPQIVEFYTSDWIEIGTKASMVKAISKMTKIDITVLLHTAQLDEFNVATRMQWAAERKTTRKEDQAYSLMGIFGINMPLLYGEGPRAFQRLQEEIMKLTEDYTLFAWNEYVKDDSDNSQSLDLAPGNSGGILAESPARFNDNESWRRHWHPYSELHTSIFTAAQSMPVVASIIGEYMTGDPPVLTSRGLLMTVPIWRKDEWEHRACLTCTRANNVVYFLCVSLRPVLSVYEATSSSKDSTFMYTPTNMGFLKFVPITEIVHDLLKYSRVYLTPNRDLAPKTSINFFSYLTVQVEEGCSISEFCPLWSHGRVGSQDYLLQKNVRLNPPPPQVKHPIQAVFTLQVSVGTKTGSFIVAFGTLAHGLPCCDIITRDLPEGNQRNVLETENEEEENQNYIAPDDDQDDNARCEYWNKIREVPKLSLNDLLRGASSFFSGKKRPGYNPIVEVFVNRSDRALSVSSGIVVMVSARRASGKFQYTLNIVAKDNSHSAPPQSPTQNGKIETNNPQFVENKRRSHLTPKAKKDDRLYDLQDALMFLDHGGVNLEDKPLTTQKDRYDPARSRTTTEYASSVSIDERSLSYQGPPKAKGGLASSIGSLMRSSTRALRK